MRVTGNTTVAYSCYGCHQAAYTAATPVKHTPANFPTSNASCQGCHSPGGIAPFPLMTYEDGVRYAFQRE